MWLKFGMCCTFAHLKSQPLTTCSSTTIRDVPDQVPSFCSTPRPSTPTSLSMTGNWRSPCATPHGGLQFGRLAETTSLTLNMLFGRFIGCFRCLSHFQDHTEKRTQFWRPILRIGHPKLRKGPFRSKKWAHSEFWRRPEGISACEPPCFLYFRSILFAQPACARFPCFFAQVRGSASRNDAKQLFGRERWRSTAQADEAEVNARTTVVRKETQMGGSEFEPGSAHVGTLRPHPSC